MTSLEDTGAAFATDAADDDVQAAEERAADTARRATRRLGLAAREARASIGQGFCDAAVVLDDAVGTSSRELAGVARGLVRARPLAVLAVAAAAGYLLGRLSR
jgi:ElaB/YqjD/DUF883 family membrane-anchored ribosome-binding protein